MTSDHNITYRMVGLDSEGGHMRLEHFAAQVNALRTTLSSFDRMQSSDHRSLLYYQVIDLQHGPYKVVVKPMFRKAVKNPKVGLISSRHDRFFGEFAKLRASGDVSDDLDSTLRSSVKRLVSGVGGQYKEAEIHNRKFKVSVDDSLKERVETLFNSERSSVGSYSGKLEEINIHGVNRFWIYPEVGPAKVMCHFLPGTASLVKELLGKNVTVYGEKFFKKMNPFPHRIEAQNFRPSSKDDVHLGDLNRMVPAVVGGEDEVAFVRRIRDQWGTDE